MPVTPVKNLIYRAACGLLPRQNRPLTASEGCPGTLIEPIRCCLRRHRVIGAQVFLTAPGHHAELLHGYARLPHTNVTENSVFRIASISKLPLALCALRLCEKGQLSLDADVRCMLPYAIVNPYYQDTPITLSALLSHSASLTDGLAYTEAQEGHIPLSDAFQTPGMYLPNRPGTVFHYANAAYSLIACLIEQVTETSFQDAVQAEVFAPLAMHVSYQPSAFSPSALCAIYRVLASRRPSFDPVDRPEPIGEAALLSLPAGNLYAQASELARLLPVLTGENALVSPEMLSRMIEPVVYHHPSNRRYGFGLGCQIVRMPDSVTWVGHQGFAYGAVCGLFAQREQRAGVVVLTNGASELRDERLAELNRDILACALAGMREAQWLV